MEQVVAAHEDITKFDEAAGQKIEHDKTAATATKEKTFKKLKKKLMGGVVPNVVKHLVLVGDVISVTTKKLCNYADKRVHDALDTIARVSALPIDKALVMTALTTAAFPKMLYGTQWTLPSTKMTQSVRTHLKEVIREAAAYVQIFQRR